MDLILHPVDVPAVLSLTALYDRAISEAVELFIVSAYLTEWKPKGSIGKDCEEMSFIVGTDFGITRKDACKAVLAWLPKAMKSDFLAADRISGFHPKLVLWMTKTGECHLVLGSSNLTQAAFSTSKAFAFFDLKMDLGYKRNKFVDNCKKNDMMIQKIRGKQCKFKDGIDKSLPENYLTISRELKYHVVVISSGNIKQDDFNKNEKDFKGLKNSCLYILTTDLHPNTYGKEQDEVLNQIKINMNEFEKLGKICRD